MCYNYKLQLIQKRILIREVYFVNFSWFKNLCIFWPWNTAKFLESEDT